MSPERLSRVVALGAAVLLMIAVVASWGSRVFSSSRSMWFDQAPEPQVEQSLLDARKSVAEARGYLKQLHPGWVGQKAPPSFELAKDAPVASQEELVDFDYGSVKLGLYQRRGTWHLIYDGELYQKKSRLPSGDKLIVVSDKYIVVRNKAGRVFKVPVGV